MKSYDIFSDSMLKVLQINTNYVDLSSFLLILQINLGHSYDMLFNGDNSLFRRSVIPKVRYSEYTALFGLMNLMLNSE